MHLAKYVFSAYNESMDKIEYNRIKAVLYARKWAYGRNPAFYNFDGLGGDCTNFVSQCIFAGSGIMNFTPVFGWFYRSLQDRTASWTGVEYLYNFLTQNQGVGPFAEETRLQGLKIGDVVQLGRATGDFYHSGIVCGFQYGFPLIAAHTYDVFGKPLFQYSFEKARFIHILGVRRETPPPAPL